MHPVLIDLGFIKIHWYGVLTAAGFLAALWHWRLRGRREGYDFNFCADLMLWTMLGGIVGARIAYVAANWETYRETPLKVFAIYEGGLIYYGGFFGAVLALGAFAWRRRKPLLPFMDFVVSAVPLGHAFGRIGCFLNGCCHGMPTDGILSVRYPVRSMPWWWQVEQGLIDRFDPQALPVYPVQLYEAGFNLALYGLLWVTYRRGRMPGRVMVMYLLVYPVGRFLLEWMRGDPRHHLGYFTTAQLFSMTLFMFGWGLYIHARRSNRSA